MLNVDVIISMSLTHFLVFPSLNSIMTPPLFGNPFMPRQNLIKKPSRDSSIQTGRAAGLISRCKIQLLIFNLPTKYLDISTQMPRLIEKLWRALCKPHLDDGAVRY